MGCTAHINYVRGGKGFLYHFSVWSGCMRANQKDISKRGRRPRAAWMTSRRSRAPLHEPPRHPRQQVRGILLVLDLNLFPVAGRQQDVLDIAVKTTTATHHGPDEVVETCGAQRQPARPPRFQSPRHLPRPQERKTTGQKEAAENGITHIAPSTSSNPHSHNAPRTATHPRGAAGHTAREPSRAAAPPSTAPAC